MNKKSMFVIMTLVIVTSIVFSPAVVPVAPNRIVHGEKLAATAPTANFTGDPTSGTAPLQVGFSDQSTGNPTGWAWWFGDESFDEPWRQMPAAIEWTARMNHTSVALPDGSIVLMGGHDGTGLWNDVWRSTDQGLTWTQMTAAAAWTAREDHTSVALPDGSIVLMGGWDGSNFLNDVWRSTDQGATWTQMTPAAEWAARKGHTSVALPDGSIVLMGGIGRPGSTLIIFSDVWRTTNQGANWTQMATNAPWGSREEHTSVALPDGSIVLMGGRLKNDVWRSTDQGETWTQMTAAAPWAGREEHTSVALPDGSIVLMGGGYFMTHVYSPVNDVWRSTDQGATWTQMTSAAEWTPRYAHTSVVLPDGSIVLMGGSPGWGYQNDVWRSTNLGANWTPRSYIYSARADHTSVLLPDGSIVLMGGYDGHRKNDVWRSTDGGATWTPMTAAAPWTARSGHNSVVLPDGNIVLMGGSYYEGGSVFLNDVWRSTDQGATWELMTPAAEWSQRYHHTSVVLHDGSIILMGGRWLNDVWRSTDQGATWTQLTPAAEWSGRYGPTSVVMPDGSIVLMGGMNYDGGFVYLNDVWRSTDQGATWTQLTAAAPWVGRTDHASVTLPDGSIVLIGGFDGSNRRNDVWRSTNQGANWTKMTDAAQWTARSGHDSVVLPDGKIVLMGGKDGTSSYRNDVWRLETAGSNDQNPSHIYTEKGIYAVALQVYNADGFSSKIKKAYINATGSIPDPDPDGLKIFLPLILH